MAPTPPPPTTPAPPRFTVAMQMLAMTLVVLAGIAYGLARQLAPPEGTNRPREEVVRLAPADGTDKIQRVLDRLTAGSIVEFSEGYYVGMLRLEDKRELVLRAAGKAVLTSMEGPPLEIDRSCQDIRLEGLEIRFATKEARTFPALVVRDATRIRLVECTIATDSGDGLVAERVAELTIHKGEINATAWCITATTCTQLTIDGTKLVGAKRGAIFTQACSGEVRNVVASRCDNGIQATGKGQLSLVGCQLTGDNKPGNGVHVGADAIVAIEGGTRVASYEKGVLVEKDGTLLVNALALATNKFVGVQVVSGARMVRLRGVDYAAQTNPLSLDGPPDASWDIDPAMLPR